MDIYQWRRQIPRKNFYDMWNKPFKPPSMRPRPMEPKPRSRDDEVERVEATPSPPGSPVGKKIMVRENPGPRPFSHASAAVNAPRKPLVVKQGHGGPKKGGFDEDAPKGYYNVMWRKYSTKKHKTWDGDGVLLVWNGKARLVDLEARQMAETRCYETFLPESTLNVGGREVQIVSLIPREDYYAGKPFTNTAQVSMRPTAVEPAPAPKQVPSFQPLKRKSSDVEGSTRNKAIKVEDGGSPGAAPAKNFYGQSSLKQEFKSPVVASTVVPKGKQGLPTARHDPHAPGALVMKRPKDCPRGKQIVDVVVDPLLAKKLRPHQREGVKFLYECVMGLRDYGGEGALLADEMGLGKTLQSIALIWTLLKQNPISGAGGVIKKVLVVCPVTLIDNWKKEFRSWLGNINIGVMVADGKMKLTDFTHGASYSVLIAGYERMRGIAEELGQGAGVDLVIVDEGHRLKKENNKAAQAIKGLSTLKKIILSGTPLQNDLTEFFVMVDFLNPALLGSANSFKKNFETPILRSRQPNASERERELGDARQAELSEMTQQFILRRTAEVQAHFLPQKTEFVVFCKPTTAQTQIYEEILESPAFMGALNGYKAAQTQALGLINILRKVCNSPRLLLPSNKKSAAKRVAEDEDDAVEGISEERLRAPLLATSTKMRVLDGLLKIIAEDPHNTKEKVVIVSNFTATLDLLQKHLSHLNLPLLRLDGDTPTNRRQDIVNEFNKTSAKKNFALLLSAKAGGVGLNLVGASRLILFDVDWNPATDLQAMARVHRPGQEKPTFIYRLLMAGGMDEKIYQRQLTKKGLADSIVDNKKNGAVFSADELRDLFTLDTTSDCKTHDLLGCHCDGRAANPVLDEPTEDAEPLDPPAPAPVPAPAPASEASASDSDSDLPLNPCDLRRRQSRPTLVPASQYDWKAEAAREAAEAAERRRLHAAGNMASLLEYEHVDPAALRDPLDVFGVKREGVEEVEGRVGDSVLCGVLAEGGRGVSYLFVKRSGEKDE
ncbi:helicase [Pseudogymnoascus australis]